MKRTKIGGALAAVANKNKIGKVVKLFPPAAMLSEGEHAKALALLRKGRTSKGSTSKIVRGLREAVNGETAERQPTSGTELLTLARHADRVDGVRALLVSIAKDPRIPDDVRLRVFEAIV